MQAEEWCQRAVQGGCERAIINLPLILACDFCGATPARLVCDLCLKVRYCEDCHAQHWNRETDPHKGHCRRAAKSSQEEAPGASTSAQ